MNVGALSGEVSRNIDHRYCFRYIELWMIRTLVETNSCGFTRFGLCWTHAW